MADTSSRGTPQLVERAIEPPGSVLGYYLDAGTARAQLRRDGVTADVEVERLSPVDAGLLLAEDLLLPGPPLELRLEVDGTLLGPWPVEVADGARRDPSGAITVRFPQATTSELRQLAAQLRRLAREGRANRAGAGTEVIEEIREPERVWSIVRSMFASDTPSRLVTAGAGPRRKLTLPPLELETDQPFALQWAIAEDWPEPPFTIETMGYMSAYSFVVQRSEARNGRLAVEVPHVITRRRTRRFRRVPAPRGASVSFSHPLWPERRVRRTVVDISWNGLGLEQTAEEMATEALFPGLRIDELELDLGDGITQRLSGWVAHEGVEPGQETGLCGLEVVALDRDLWTRELSRVFYKNTELARDDDEELWELYRRAGYFNLSGKHEEHFKSLRAAFTVAQQRIAANPEVGCQIVWPSEEGLEATITSLKIYSHSWLAFQLARWRRPASPHAGRYILRDVVLHGLEYPYRDAGFRWLVTWVQPDTHFSRLVSYELARRFTSLTDKVSVMPFEAMEGVARADVPEDPRYRIGDASAAEIETLLAVIRGTRPLPYREAHDLVPERLGLASLSSAWGASGMRRVRVIKVARAGGRPVAAAVLELADDGVHLFSLLDSVRLFPLATDGAQAYTALLRAASRWYHEQGKRTFVYFDEDGALEPALAAGCSRLGTADLMVIDSDIMPDQLENAWEVTVPRDIPPPPFPPFPKR